MIQNEQNIFPHILYGQCNLKEDVKGVFDREERIRSKAVKINFKNINKILIENKKIQLEYLLDIVGIVLLHLLLEYEENIPYKSRKLIF